jgi:hypothetical protein
VTTAPEKGKNDFTPPATEELLSDDSTMFLPDSCRKADLSWRDQWQVAGKFVFWIKKGIDKP